MGLVNPTMCIEPGRYLVGDASVLLTKVNTIKQSYRKFEVLMLVLILYLDQPCMDLIIILFQLKNH